MQDDALTPEEIAEYRRFYFGVDRERKRWRLGAVVMWRGLDCWRAGVSFGPWLLGVTYQSFAAYEQHKVALGPYRNA